MYEEQGMYRHLQLMNVSGHVGASGTRMRAQTCTCAAQSSRRQRSQSALPALEQSAADRMPRLSVQASIHLFVPATPLRSLAHGVAADSSRLHGHVDLLPAPPIHCAALHTRSPGSFHARPSSPPGISFARSLFLSLSLSIRPSFHIPLRPIHSVAPCPLPPPGAPFPDPAAARRYCPPPHLGSLVCARWHQARRFSECR